MHLLCRGQPKIGRWHKPGLNEFHHPGNHPTQLNCVNPQRIHKVVQFFSRPLIENAALRAERLVGFIILLVNPLIFLACN